MQHQRGGQTWPIDLRGFAAGKNFRSCREPLFVPFLLRMPRSAAWPGLVRSISTEELKRIHGHFSSVISLPAFFSRECHHSSSQSVFSRWLHLQYDAGCLSTRLFLGHCATSFSLFSLLRYCITVWWCLLCGAFTSPLGSFQTRLSWLMKDNTVVGG